MNDRANKILQFWSERFPKRKPDHLVFPSERYGAGGDTFEPCVYDLITHNSQNENAAVANAVTEKSRLAHAVRFRYLSGSR